MMSPLDLYACGNGQPVYVTNYEDWIYSYDIFDYVSTLAPSVATDPGSTDLLFTNSAAGTGPENFFDVREAGNYFDREDSRHAEIDLQIFRSSPDYFPSFNRLGSAENIFTSDGALAELPPIRDFQLSDHQINEPRTETVQGLNGGLALPFGESLLVSDSMATMATMASSLEQEEKSADARNFSVEDIITSMPAAELYPAIESPHNIVVSAASPCPAHRSKNGSKRKRSDERTAEIRISKKIPQNGMLPKSKAWLGTYATPAQRGRALDVGKYFLCTKKKKTFSNSSSEALLATFQDRLHILPLPELVDIVTKMAKHYGEHGWLPESLHDL